MGWGQVLVCVTHGTAPVLAALRKGWGAWPLPSLRDMHWGREGKEGRNSRGGHPSTFWRVEQNQGCPEACGVRRAEVEAHAQPSPDPAPLQTPQSTAFSSSCACTLHSNRRCMLCLIHTWPPNSTPSCFPDMAGQIQRLHTAGKRASGELAFVQALLPVVLELAASLPLTAAGP